MGNMMKKGKITADKLYISAQSFLLVFFIAITLGLMGWLFGGASLAVMAVGGVVLLYFLNPMVPPQIIMKLQKARPLAYRESPQLHDGLQILSQRARLPQLPVLYYIPSHTMNAFTIGTRENAAIAVTDGLLRHLGAHELSAVMAHEISHLRHDDLRIMGFAALSHQLVQMLALIGQILLLLNLPLLLLGQYTVSWMAILALIFAPSLSAMLQLALSRAREYRADIGAAELIGDGHTLASALAKMESFQKRYLRGLFWPRYQTGPGSALLRTHPPTTERVRRLLKNQDRRPTKKRRTLTPRNGYLAPRVIWYPPRQFMRDNYYRTSATHGSLYLPANR